MLERKKLKSWSPGVTESRSFLVRYRRTYVLKKNNIEIEIILMPNAIIIFDNNLKNYLDH